MTASPNNHAERAHTALPKRRVAAGRHLIALTRDPALAQALQELAGPNLSIHLVEDLRGLADELMQHATAVALLDAQALAVPADAAVDAVKSQFPDLRLMVAGYVAEQAMLASRIAEQKVFRFVQKPASPQRLKVFLEAAALQRPERRAVDRFPDAPVGAGSTRPPGGAAAQLPMLAGGLAVAILAVGAWLLLREDDATAAPSGVATIQDPAVAPGTAAVLARAEAAFAAGRLIAADGSSAAELYRAALRLDAGSAAAADGFERTIEAALAGAEQALLAGELEQARVTAELLRLIVPDSSHLAFLYTQIERELARLDADTTQQQALEAQRAQIRAAVAAVDERIAAGALLEPATDSAVSRFRKAQTMGGGDPMVRGSRDALVGALLTAADSELTAGRIATAGRLVDAAGSINSSASGLDIMRRRVDAAAVAGPVPASESVPAPVAAATSTAALTPDAAPVAAPAPAGVGPNTGPATPASAGGLDGTGVVSSARLQTLRRAEPEFPLVAAQQGISGWVELEFTVTTEGSVKDVIVTASEPRRTFDSVALAALKRYRYAPVLHDGQPVEQRARLRMRFSAQD
ncbi:MAG TPA: energy transducer TonB [Steroidobacteraceae bacterium]|nr:energy transducer TonB [Steroidobacteraceae bacterium]